MGYPVKQLLGVVMLVFIRPGPLLGAPEPEKGKGGRAASEAGDFVLIVQKTLISLKAQEASLRAILEEMGREMRIEVLGDVSEDEKITTEFAKLPMAEALQRLSSNYGYQIGSEKGGNNVAKIFVLPKGTGTGLSRQALKESEPVEEPGFQISERVIEAESAKEKESEKEQPSRPEPFKFEFDPSAFMKKGE